MAVNKILDATNKLVSLLQSLESSERARVVQAAYLLLGEAAPAPSVGAVVQPPGNNAGRPIAGVGDERAFFEEKQPENKIEELAVAARYREERLDAAKSSKEELRAVIKAARRNFDDKNFSRDINNAKTKGLFNKGPDIVLAHYGQNYVDALPDREAIKALRRPKGAGGKRASPAAARRASPAKKAAK